MIRRKTQRRNIFLALKEMTSHLTKIAKNAKKF